MACLNQVWTDNYSEQVDYIQNLFQTVSEVDSSFSTITLYQATEPSTANLLDAYETQTGLVSQPPIGTEFSWYNPNTNVIENIYRVVEDIGLGLSTGNPISYTTKDRSLDFLFLGEVNILDDSPASSFVFTGLPATYNHFFMTMTIRSTLAAVIDNLTVRLNTVATANYGSERTTLDGAAVAALAGISQTGLADTGGTVGNTTAQPSLYTTGYMFLLNIKTQSGFNLGTITRKIQWNGASPVVAANRNSGAVYSLLNAAAITRPVNRVDVVTPANYRHGSKMSIYGWK